MLARSPIRTKLLLALAILTAIISTLAFSGFWGLYRYRSLANNINHRAAEIPQINALLRSVETMRDSCRRIEDDSFNSFKIGPDPILSESIQRSESDRFDDALQEFGSVLARYQVSLAASSSEDNLFLDPEQQQRLLNRIDKALQCVRSTQRRQLHDLEAIEFATLQLDLDALADYTQQLPSMLQRRMAGVRDQVRGQYRTWITLAWSCTVLALVMLGVLLWLFKTLIMQPFQNLLEGCRLVACGHFDHTIELGTGDELDELGQAMNGMTERFRSTRDGLNSQVRQRTREVIQREQLASVGFLAAGVAHEINNPLASIAWSAEALESRLHDVLHSTTDECTIMREEAEALKKNLTRIQDEAFRCKGITERLLDFSRMSNVTVAPTDLGELVSEVVSMVGTLGQYRCKSIRIECPETVIAEINAQEIRQVILNLLTNALESVPSDGLVIAKVEATNSQASVSVTDNGCGMSDEVCENLFEPFFTRRQDGRGTGLGLSITHRIISKHGGVITAHSDGEGHGSRLEFSLPINTMEPNHVASQVA
ncbi:Sensor protein ZraS [Roseimaritima multifibrata]|uniref:histidine kinase n=1 Tax=Roseimaritima multifibrata TaxID=1930274 RepID=A0A517MMX5_9BACT|nr:HAMP domain-containing sensor histidine kinase [Roseimaritima multifibrata]QDS96245.1 Sensor protein ZraS [Roseimaritima multifibrata]